LKKQTQFAGGQIDAKSYSKGDYEETAAVWVAKNKANSKPICRPSAGNSKLEIRNPKQIRMTEILNPKHGGLGQCLLNSFRGH